jgi:thiamine-monophosphate kinase
MPRPPTHAPSARRSNVLTGIGDDCAILRIPAGHELLVTTDFSLEGVHFRREWHPPESVGHRCLARGLSDIAAMGGEPMAAFLSLALPKKLPQKWVDGFLRGFLKLASEFGVTLAGGDTSRSSGGVLADIIVVGSVANGRAILRSGARPGDRIYVSGALGGSAATVALFYCGHKKKSRTEGSPNHFFPTPRIQVGRILRLKNIATAMIDLSDGLSTDLSHICDESGCGAEILEEAIPKARIGKPAREVAAEFFLHGGEDYELLFTARGRIRVPSEIAGIQISEIGRITRDKRILVSPDGSKSELKPEGWEHFRQRSRRSKSK